MNIPPGSSPRYVVIGNATLDKIYTAHTRTEGWVCGGNAFYTAVGIALWDGPVGVVTRVGSDFPVAMLDDFTAAGLNLAGVQYLDQPHQLKGEIVYHGDGSRDFFLPREGYEKSIGDGVAVNSNRPAINMMDYNPTPLDLPDDYWNAQGFGLASMNASAQIPFIRALASRELFFTWDSPDLDGDERATQLWLEKVPAALPSFEEIGWLIGEREAEEALDYLQGFGPKVIGLKLGASGSLVCETDTGKRWRIPAYPAEVLDPTGAGDAYCGGFLAGYCVTGDFFEAALRAVVSASFVIEGFDARYALGVSSDQAEARLAAIRSRVIG